MTLWRATTVAATFMAGITVGLLAHELISGIFERRAAARTMVTVLKATGAGTSPSPSTFGSGTAQGRKETFYDPWLSRWIESSGGHRRDV